MATEGVTIDACAVHVVSFRNDILPSRPSVIGENLLM